MNYGNTGQRYKLRKRTAVTIQGDHIHVELECGHTYDARPDEWGSVEHLARIMQAYVGKRERCNECSA